MYEFQNEQVKLAKSHGTWYIRQAIQIIMTGFVDKFGVYIQNIKNVISASLTYSFPMRPFSNP